MPDMFQGHGSLGWNFLLDLPEKWSWLIKPFGDKTDYHVALSAYYLGLHILELADCVFSGNEKILV